MNTSGKEQRRRERIRLELPVRVLVRERRDEQWTEVTRVQDLTPFGARFSLARPVDCGRLLHLTLPMPRALRCFDHVEDQYCVWALVRRVTALAPAAAHQRPRFDLGVAFVGKHAPRSFMTNPELRYEIAPDATAQDLWRVRELAAGPRQPVARETRLSMPVEVVVEVLDEQGGVAAQEQTVTENLSRRGAAVFSSLAVAPGRFVRLRSTLHGLTVLAVVRRQRKGADGIPRLHLEFVDRGWPLELDE